VANITFLFRILPKVNFFGEVFVVERVEGLVHPSVRECRHHLCILDSVVPLSADGSNEFLPSLEKSSLVLTFFSYKLNFTLFVLHTKTVKNAKLVE